MPLVVLTGDLRDPMSWMDWLHDAFAPAPQRFAHSHTVWQRASSLDPSLLPWLTPDRAQRLQLAALLHDVGRALDPAGAEPHGFVGARLLDELGLVDVAPLVAHHSGAREEAAARGMARLDVWVDRDPELDAVLTYLDRTTGPRGHVVSLAGRRSDLAARYGSRSLNVALFDATLPIVGRAISLLGPDHDRGARREFGVRSPGVHRGVRSVGRVQPAADREELTELAETVAALRARLIAAEADRADAIAATDPIHRRSATNLVHYVALRGEEMRDVQQRLVALGLSSLGRSEANVLGTVEAVLAALTCLAGGEPAAPTAAVGITEGRALLDLNAERLLGPPADHRSTRIMVTLPSDAATDADLVHRLCVAGMDIARINCAHDDVDAWEAMVQHLRSPLDGAGHACRVAMDLAGPKLRTGPLQPGPRVVRIAPARDRLGRVTEPATIWLCGLDGGLPAGTVVPVEDPSWLARRAVDDMIQLTDSRGARRHWRVTECTAAGCRAVVEETSYVQSGATLAAGADGCDTVVVGALPEVEQAHRVGLGDRVVLTRSLEPAVPTPVGSVHRIGCTLPEAFDSVKPGETVWFDDGKIGGTVDAVSADEIGVVVTDVRPGGANLRAGKGINLPDTQLALAALTAKDLEDLPHVARLADVVNLSFVREPDDVAQLQAALHGVGADDVGIVLKVENATAFANLPELLLQAMRSPRVGVMIARGDLAVEVGFERLAEVQEEIMWACEAAHVPVIWATQVLDTLARTGQPSRAEVTDAAMAQRAECVMLNKGPRITEAIGALDSILARMGHHQDKKRSLLRKLRAWDR